MPKRSPVSSLRWLFYCAICFATLELRAQEPKQVIVVESWIAAIDFQKLRALDLTWDQVNANGQPRSLKIAEVLEGKADNAAILQQPDELLKLLQRAGVARVLAEPKMATVSGQKATLEIGDPDSRLKLEATPITKANGQIQMEIRTEITEPLPGPRGLQSVFGGNQPRKRQWRLSSKVESEAGMVSLDATLIRGMPNSPTPVPVVLVRATLEKPGSLAPTNVETATATHREIR